MTFNPIPFKVNFSESQISNLKSKIRAANSPRPTYETSQAARGKYGVTSEWMNEARKRWVQDFEWKPQQDKINQTAQYTVTIPHPPDHPLQLHFVHEPSPSRTARPLLILHGWPSSYHEFLSLVSHLKGGEFHLVVPSMPGYAFSDPPPLDRDFTMSDVATVCHQLMVGLGYDKYFVQAGDWGMRTVRTLAKNYPENVVAVSANFLAFGPPKTFLHSVAPAWCRYRIVDWFARTLQIVLYPVMPDPATYGISQEQKKGIERGNTFQSTGSAYLMEHKTRPATIAHVVASSPVALLAWVGEKFLEWTDEDPSWDEMFTALTIWAITDTFPSSIYNYRATEGAAVDPKYYIEQPTGYSNFAKELVPSPPAWAAQTCNLQWHKYHEKGGHFAAWEKPEVLAQDIREFFATIKWPAM